MNRRRMHLGMSIRGLGYHPAAWRHPDVPADGALRFDHYARRGLADRNTVSNRTRFRTRTLLFVARLAATHTA